MKKFNFKSFIVMLAFVMIVFYTVAVLLLAWFDHMVPDSLTIAFFAAMVGELSILGMIKIKENKDED